MCFEYSEHLIHVRHVLLIFKTCQVCFEYSNRHMFVTVIACWNVCFWYSKYPRHVFLIFKMCHTHCCNIQNMSHTYSWYSKHATQHVFSIYSMSRHMFLIFTTIKYAFWCVQLVMSLLFFQFWYILKWKITLLFATYIHYNGQIFLDSLLTYVFFSNFEFKMWHICRQRNR